MSSRSTTSLGAAPAGEYGQAGSELLEKVRELQASERRTAALLELGQRLMAERDPKALLRHVCVAAREMTRASIAGVGIVADDAQRLEHVVAVGIDEARAAELRPAMELSAAIRNVLQTRQPIRRVNPSGDPTALSLPAWHPPVHSFLLAPIASPSRVYGWFALVEKVGGDAFSEVDERIAMTLGAQVGMAYENASLVAQLVHQAKALRDHEDDMEFAMSVARTGVSHRELDSNIIMLSRSLANLLGLPPGTTAISREDFLARVHPNDADKVRETVGDAVRRGSEFELEYRVQTGERGWRWFRSNGRVTSKRQGQQPRLFSGLTDVTEHRSLELQLHQSQKMEALGQLAGGIAHDFNNLLTAISGYARLFLESVQPEARQDVEEIVKAADRAASLTKQLLAFGRRQVMETSILDLNVLVGDMAVMLRRLIVEDIDLTTNLAEGVLAVRADRGQLEQVMMNLVLNARDATSAGGSIRIETGLADLDGGAAAEVRVKRGRYVTLAVADTGCGMTEETKARVFEPFFTTKPLGRGTGLGLATVYGIVAQTGGAIAVTSEPGAGSTFTVYLPGEVNASATLTRPAPTTLAGGAETVLLAEDETAVRTLVRKILQRAGYEVVEAANAAEAESRAAQMPSIDLLLTDVVMPGGNGPDLFRRLAAARPDMRVLFMSGHAKRDLFDRAAIDPTAEFLEKPFSADVLISRVRHVLDR